MPARVSAGRGGWGQEMVGQEEEGVKGLEGREGRGCCGGSGCADRNSGQDVSKTN